MKDLKTLCNVNITNSLHSLLESSILDIEGTIKDGDKINNADLNDILSTKSEELYNIIYDVLKSNIYKNEKSIKIITNDSGKKVFNFEPDKYYISFYKHYDSFKRGTVNAIEIGNYNETVQIKWQITSNKISFSWSNIGFSPIIHDGKELYSTPKKWHKDIEKLIAKVSKK